MAQNLSFNSTFGESICNFTHNNIAYTRNAGQQVNYEYNSASPTLSMARISMKAASNPGTNVSITAELKIGNSTTGQKTLTRVDDTTFELKVATTPNSVAVPASTSEISCQIIIRVNGTVKTTSTFTIPPPLVLSVSSISPSPATGKACTVTLNKTIPSSWKLADKITVGAYHDSTVYRLSVYGYRTDMATILSSGSSGFSQFTFYVPYDSSKTKTDNEARIRILVRASPNHDYFEAYSSNLLEIDLKHTFTMSYVNQTDPAANPTVTLNAIAENPSGMLSKYGKYVGGGIGKLTFSLASWACKFGSGFASRTVYLYNSDGTLNKSWTYSNTNSFTLTLTNKTDAAWYVVISITDTAGRTGSATTAVFQAYGYEAPTILGLTASRCNQDGTANDSGEYCKISWWYKIYALGDHNSKKNTVVTPVGTRVYTNIDYDRSVNGYMIIVAADTETSYQISLTVEDDFDSVTQTMNLSTAGVLMDFLYNGKGIGLGKVAETSNMVEVNPEWTFKAQTIMIRGQDLATILQSLGYTFPT